MRESPQDHRLGGRWLVAAAAVLWSTSGFFAKAPLFNDWPLEQRGILLAFWRAVFAGIVLMPMVRRPQWSRGLIPLVLSFALMNYTYLTAMTLTTAANAIWLQNVAPVWVFLIGVFAFGGLQMGLPYFLFARGVRSITGHEASGIALLEPVLVPVWVFLAWHGLAVWHAGRQDGCRDCRPERPEL